MTAQVIQLSDHRSDVDEAPAIDLVTAVDVAIRDLREIEACWGSERALARLCECQALLSRALWEASEGC